MAGNYCVHIMGTQEWHGPFGLKRAKDFARIGATHGKHDRAVVRGDALVRIYEAGTGDRLFPGDALEAHEYLTPYEVPRQFKKNPRTDMRLGYTSDGMPMTGEIDDQDVRYVHVFAGDRYLGQIYDSGGAWFGIPANDSGWEQFITSKNAAEWLSKRYHG